MRTIKDKKGAAQDLYTDMRAYPNRPSAKRLLYAEINNSRLERSLNPKAPKNTESDLESCAKLNLDQWIAISVKRVACSLHDSVREIATVL